MREARREGGEHEGRRREGGGSALRGPHVCVRPTAPIPADDTEGERGAGMMVMMMMMTTTRRRRW